MGTKRTILIIISVALILTLTAGCTRPASKPTEKPPVEESLPPGPETTLPPQPPPGTSTGGPVSQAQVAAAVEVPPPGLPPAPSSSAIKPGTTVTHRVQKGDWLLQIARCYGASYERLLKANDLGNPSLLRIGSQLRVPDVGSQGQIIGPPCVQLYTIKQGDTPQSIANQFGSPPAIIQNANPGALNVGRKIYVPTVPSAPGPVEIYPPPVVSGSMLFILNGDLATYSGASGTVSYIPDESAEILDIATNGDGGILLIKQTRDSRATVEFAVLDRGTGILSVLEAGQPLGPALDFFESMLINPQSTYGAYLVDDGVSLRLTAFSTANPGTLSHRVLTHPRSEVSSLLIPQLFPGATPDQFLLIDSSGIYLVPFTLGFEDRLYAIDPEDPDQPLAFKAVSWSPGNAYLLLIGYGFEGSQYYVLDPLTRSLVLVPDSTRYGTASAAGWSAEGSLNVLIPPTDESQVMPTNAYYLPAVTNGVFELQLVGSTPLPAPEGDNRHSEPGYFISMPPSEVTSATLNFAIQSTGSSVDAWWNFQGAPTPNFFNSMPAGPSTTGWSLDRTSLLAETASAGEIPEQVYLVPGDTTPIFSLTAWLGANISDFHWVSP